MAEALQPTSHLAHTDNNDLRELLLYFSKTTCQADSTDTVCINAMKKSVALMKQDYGVVLVSNSSCDLSTHYPSELILLEREHIQGASSAMGPAAPPARTPSTIYENSYDPIRLRELINKARLARCRVRFPMPVILYKDKLICRSSTLAGAPETYGRLGYNFLFSGSEPTGGASFESDDLSPGDWDLIDSVRGQDIKLLTTFNVGTIVDFMVENKKVKYGVNVTSSEKVDKENRYSNFTMISLPYPGCEFFKKFRDNNYEAQSLIFDWSQAYIDANIRVPDDNIASQMRIDWDSYKEWDLVRITQNYMRLMLRYLQESNSGILIHCISGWDRTPLFISLLRISLWADGVVHQSLDTTQLLYLTIAYDWMLFGHHLSDRLEKGEDIFYFCFYMLKHLEDDEFSILGSSRMRSGRLSDRNLDRAVKRTDSDLYLDAMLLEMESHGSNMSLNSNSSSISNRSQEPFLSMPEETTNSNHPGMTQELTIPHPIRTANPSSTPPLPITGPRETGIGLIANRQRHESSSSLSGDGWQFISGTGSFRGSDTTSSSTFESNSSNTIRDDSRESTPRLCDVFSNGIEVHSNRRDRLKSLRRLFINIYGPAVGFKFNSGSDRSLGSFFGNIAEKVGLSARNNS